MSAKMLEQADAIRTRFAVCESVPGSGYHDNDRNPTRNEIFVAPQKRGFCKASENIVPFVGDYEVVLIGDDAHKAYDILYAYGQYLATRESLTAQEAKVRKAISKLKVNKVNDIDRLMLRRPLWNDYIEIFYKKGQGISCLPFTEEE